MSQHLFNDTDITAIADAIRTKKGTQNTMTVGQMPSEIESIPTGGSDEPVAVRFIDFEGTVVQELTQEELDSLTELPSGPDHSEDEIPLTFDEWNITLENLKAWRRAHPDWTYNVGALYHTTDNKMHLIYEVMTDNYSVSIQNKGTGTLVMDWGDGTIDRVSSGTTQAHTFVNKGRYDVTIDDAQHIIEARQTITLFSAQNYLEEIRMSRFIDLDYIILVTTHLKSISFSSDSTICGVTSYLLKWYSIPNNVTKIYMNNQNLLYQPMHYGDWPSTSYSLSECPGIEQLYIPMNIVNLDAYAFRYDTGIKRAFVGPLVASIGNGCFQYCYNLEEVVFQSTNALTSIPNSMFSNCWKLRSITIPSNVTSMGNSVFQNCVSLLNVTIPSTVTSIGNGVFSGTYTNVTMESTTPPTLGTNDFDSGTDRNRIFVPWSSDHSVLEAYKTATNWSSYASIIFESPEPTA